MIIIDRSTVSLVNAYDAYRETECGAGYISISDWIDRVYHGCYDHENSRITFENEVDALAFKIKFKIYG